MPIDRRRRREFGDIARADALDQKMRVSRCYIDDTRFDLFAPLRLDDVWLAQAIKLLGKRGGEIFRHVLHDQRRRAICGKSEQKILDCLGAAGRRTDEQDRPGGCAAH